MFYWESLQYSIEAIQWFFPNVVRFQLAKGERWWYIIGCYLAPNNASTIESVISALRNFPRGAELLLVGDFNADLAQTEGAEQDEEIVADLAAAV